MVAFWLMEVNEEGAALWKIGFNAAHQPVLFAPTSRNDGVWAYFDCIFSSKDFSSQKDFPFDATWKSLYAQTNEGIRSQKRSEP